MYGRSFFYEDVLRVVKVYNKSRGLCCQMLDLILSSSSLSVISSPVVSKQIKEKGPSCGRGTTEISRINCCRCGLDKEKLSNFENFFLHVDVDWMSYNNKMLFLNSFVANRQGKGIHKQSIRLYVSYYDLSLSANLQYSDPSADTVPVLSNLPVSHLLI